MNLYGKKRELTEEESLEFAHRCGFHSLDAMLSEAQCVQEAEEEQILSVFMPGDEDILFDSRWYSSEEAFQYTVKTLLKTGQMEEVSKKDVESQLYYQKRKELEELMTSSQRRWQ